MPNLLSRDVGRRILIIVISVVAALRVARSGEIAVGPGQVGLGHIAMSVESHNQTALVVPHLILRPNASDDDFLLDVLVHVSDGPVVVVDPFLRAPGLQFAHLVLFDENQESVRTIRFQRPSVAGIAAYGSIIVPDDGIVGTRIRLSVTPANGKAVAHYCQLYLSAGFSTGVNGPAVSLEKGLVGRSDAIRVGSFPLYSFVAAYAEGAVRTNDTATEVSDSDGIHARAERFLSDDVAVSFFNSTDRAIGLLDPWLRRYQTTEIPVQLWIKNNESRTNLLRRAGVSERPTATIERVVLPQAAIYGRMLTLPPIFAENPDSTLELIVAPEFFADSN